MPDKPTIVVSETLQPAPMRWLREQANVIEATPETAIDVIDQADGLVVRTYTQVNEALLDRAPQLKVVGRAGVALENVHVPLCQSRGVQVVHTPAANTLAVVDYVTRMLVEMNREFWPLPGYVEAETFHAMRKQMAGRFLAGCTLGIVGVGRIGSRVGRIAHAMRMRVLGNDVLPPEQLDVDYPIEWVSKDELYAQSDIITIHTPAIESTAKFIDAQAIAKMKPGVQFINAARGQCVDYPALGAGLRSGQVGFAVIDCHDPEPMPADYPLYGLDNVILTPHCAACVPEAKINMSWVVRDVVAVCNGRDPEYPAQEGAY
jgi:phosphoglycerate dehydrogenase-like enzyme